MRSLRSRTASSATAAPIATSAPTTSIRSIRHDSDANSSSASKGSASKSPWLHSPFRCESIFEGMTLTTVRRSFREAVGASVVKWKRSGEGSLAAAGDVEPSLELSAVVDTDRRRKDIARHNGRLVHHDTTV